MSYPANRPSLTRPGDAEAGIELTDAFEPFAQRNDIFTRAMWDETVRSKHTDAFFRSYRMEAAPRRGDGFGQRDFALRNAAWLISDVMTNRFAANGRRERAGGAPPGRARHAAGAAWSDQARRSGRRI